MKVYPYINDIQLWPSPVWNYYKVGFDPNKSWELIVFTNKCCNVSMIWWCQTWEHALLWCSILVFSQSYGQLFVTPVSIHQLSTLAEDLTYSLPGDWTVNESTSCYIYRGGWLKATSHFRTALEAIPYNRQIISFGFNYSHCDEDSFDTMGSKTFYTFILKTWDINVTRQIIKPQIIPL